MSYLDQNGTTHYTYEEFNAPGFTVPDNIVDFEVDPPVKEKPMQLSDVKQMVFNAGSAAATPPPLVAFNPAAAIAAKWESEKAGGKFHGVPVTPEVKLDDGSVAQGFSSGAVFHWTGGDVVDIL